MKSSRFIAILTAITLFAVGATAVIYAGHCQAHYEYCAAHNVPLIFLRGVGIFIDDHNGAFVALFTCTLWWTTSRTLHQLEREFVAAHRPRLVLRSVTFEGSDAEPLPEHPTIKVEFANVEGLGPINVVAHLAFGLFPTGKLVPWKMAEEVNKTPALSIQAPRGGSAAIRVLFPPERAADFKDIRVVQGVWSIYCIGYVVYSDIEGKHSYRLGFVRRCDLRNRWFERIDFPDFSYAD